MINSELYEIPRVEFPNLFNGSLEINPVAISIFGLDIYWYGILIAVGVILGFVYALKRAKQFGLIADHVFDVAFVAIICGFIGARVYYCIFIDSNINFFDLRSGGLAIYGGIIAAAIGAAVMCRIRKVRLPALFDLGGLGLFIGQCIGRWGNFVNQEAFGAPTAGNLPWGMWGTKIAMDDTVVAMEKQLFEEGSELHALVHPCFLYESLLCLVGFIFLHFYSKKLKTFDGELFLIYVFWYGTGRGFIEGLRTDSLYIGAAENGLKVSQIVGFVSAAIALILFIVFKLTKTKARGYMMYKDTDLCAERLADYDKKQMIADEKAKAKKAMKQKKADAYAPSILADDGSDDETDGKAKEETVDGDASDNDKASSEKDDASDSASDKNEGSENEQDDQ